jgi:hypothetical protein
VLFAPPQWQIKLQDYQKRRLLVYFGRDYASTKTTEAEGRPRACSSATTPTLSSRH